MRDTEITIKVISRMSHNPESNANYRLRVSGIRARELGQPGTWPS